MHANSLANLRRGNVGPTKKPRKPKWNNTREFILKMNARRLELMAERRRERERLAAKAVAQAPARGEGVPEVRVQTRTRPAPPSRPPETIDDFAITPPTLRTAGIYRMGGSPFRVHRQRIGTVSVVRACLGRGVGWRPTF